MISLFRHGRVLNAPALNNIIQNNGVIQAIQIDMEMYKYKIDRLLLETCRSLLWS